MKKTTVSISYKMGFPNFSLYYSYWESGYCFISFTGSEAKEWEQRWTEYRTKEALKEREVFDKEKERKVKALEDALLVSVDGFFTKRRKPIEDKLVEEKKKEYWLSNFSLHKWIYAFLPDDCVKISRADNTIIYEILSKSPSPTSV